MGVTLPSLDKRNLRESFFELLKDFSTFPATRNLFLVKLYNLPEALTDDNQKKLGVTINSQSIDKARSVYEKYILKPCPSFETKSKKLTAWITQIIKVRHRDKTIKNKDISLKSFLKINFFIEI